MRGEEILRQDKATLKSRAILRILLSAVFVLVLATPGWCLDGPSRNGGNNFSIGGGLSRWTTIEGHHGQNGGFDLNTLGLKGRYTNTGRVQFNSGELYGMGFSFTWDHFFSFGHGSSYYDGPPHPVMNPGDTVDAQLFITVNALSFDGNVASMVGGGTWLAAGPRLQLVRYEDTLKISDAEAGQDIIGSNRYTLFGLGFWSSLDLASLTSISWPSRYVTFEPRLNAALAAGQGHGMRYWEWEAFLQVLTAARTLYSTPYATVGPLKLEIGYAWYSVTETGPENRPLPGSQDENVSLRIGMPLIRGSLYVSF